MDNVLVLLTDSDVRCDGVSQFCLGVFSGDPPYIFPVTGFQIYGHVFYRGCHVILPLGDNR